MHFIRADHLPSPQALQVEHGGRLYRLGLVHCTTGERRLTQSGSSPHRHDLYHIVLFSSGRNRFSLAGGEVDCSAGSLVLCPPGIAHDFGPRLEGEVCYDETTFELVCSHQRLAIGFGELLSDYAGVALGAFPVVTQLAPPAVLRIRDMMHRLTKEALGASPLGLLRAHCALLDLLLGLGEVLGLESPASAVDAVEIARREITLRYSQPLSIVRLARELGISPAHLARAFKARYGISPRDFQQDLRLSAATRLLLSSSLSCKEVAARLGFADVQTFTKAFGRHYGRTPGAVVRAARR